jgi:hypothetical protein
MSDQRPDPPSSISTAVTLMRVGALVSMLSLAVSLSTLGSLKDTIADSLRTTDPDVAQYTIDANYSVATVSAVIGGLFGAVLWLWMAWKNGQGRAWARFVATVLGILNLLSLIYSLGTPGVTAASLAFGVLSLVLALVILVLLWLRRSSLYYHAVPERQMI